MLKKSIPVGISTDFPSSSPPETQVRRKNPRLLNKVGKCLIALLSFMLLSVTMFGQGSSASLSGTVQDSSRAVISGASVTARNVETNLESHVTTNDAGIYTFGSLLAGTYEVVVEAAGFQRNRTTDVRLRATTANTLNINLEVRGVTTDIEVIASAESMILEAGASTGTVLQEEMVTQLPVFTGSVLDLINLMGGVVQPDVGAFDPVFGLTNTTFAGVLAGDVNITRDGISVNEPRYNSGINSPNRINPELVGEFRMVLSPVDAEMGRGAGQVQITTRSGSNNYRGTAVWNIQNTALDANEWAQKAREIVLTPPWRNLNDYTVSYSGPIIRNQTFFFATWQQVISKTKTSATQTVLTACARKGVYRYLDGVLSTNAIGNPSLASRDISYDGVTTRHYSLTRPSVNLDGSVREQFTVPAGNTNMTPSPWPPTGTSVSAWSIALGNDNYLTGQRPDDNSSWGPEFTGLSMNNHLYYESLFGPMSAADRQILGGNATNVANAGSSVYTDCGAYTERAPGFNYDGGWDKYRDRYDGLGFISNFSAKMPLPNDFSTSGDGLNTAIYRWTRMMNGSDTIFGTGDAERKSISVKIDHQLTSAHRLSGTYTYESAHSDDSGVVKVWGPDSYNGRIDRTPQTFQASISSTIRPTLLNELRVGLSRTQSAANAAVDSATYGDAARKFLADFFPTGGEGWNYSDIIIPAPGGNYPGTYGNILGGANTTSWGGHDPRWTVVENVTWIKGAHNFKGGLEFRYTQSWQSGSGNQQFDAYNMIPNVNGGVSASNAPWGMDDQRAVYISSDQATNRKPQGPFTGAYNGYRWGGLSEYDQWGDIGGRSTAAAPGSTNKFSNAYTILGYLSGAVNNIRQFYFNKMDNGVVRWNIPGKCIDSTACELGKDYNETLRVLDLRQKELHLFFKDDWRITSDLTLNLGARWEYYGVPFEARGNTLGVLDGIEGMRGVSRNLSAWMSDFDTLMNQGPADYAGLGTTQAFIGPNTNNPNVAIYNKDLNNFAPHVGFGWQLPWFGKGKTTLRGGYSISYTAVTNMDSTSGFSGYAVNGPGTTRSWAFTGNPGCNKESDPYYDPNYCYINFNNVKDFLPLDIRETGMLPLGHPDRGYTTNVNRPVDMQGASSLTIYDPNVRNPYVQNVNLSLTRNFLSMFTVDVRYIATLQRKGMGSLALNTTNYIHNGMYREVEKLRKVGADEAKLKSREEFPILNSGIIPYAGDGFGNEWGSLYALAANNVNRLESLNWSGAEQFLYLNWSNIAAGNFLSPITSLATANFNANLNTMQAGMNDGQFLRPSVRENESSGQVLRAGIGPDNLIRINPQYDTVNIQRNQGRSNYHSMQTQVTMRPVHGLNFQATWTWSRSLSRGGVYDYGSGLNPGREWEQAYNLSGSNRKHTLRTNGSYELPFGARGFLFRDAQGAFKKAIENWSFSWIGSISAGSPMSNLSGLTTIWGSSRMDQVGPFDAKDSGVKWHDYVYIPQFRTLPAVERRAYGTYFNKDYRWVADPVCNPANGYLPYGDANDRDNPGWNKYASSSMQTSCGRQALYEVNPNDPDDKSKIIFQNAKPGTIGNQMNYIMTGPTRWSLDAAMAKSVEFMEGKSLEFRLDAQNIFNHATPSYSAPTADGNVNVTYFGGRTVGTSNPNAPLTEPGGNISGTPFGYLNYKAGHRTFQARLRLTF